MRIECPWNNARELSYLETQQKRIIQQIPRKTETLGGYDAKKSKKESISRGSNLFETLLTSFIMLGKKNCPNLEFWRSPALQADSSLSELPGKPFQKPAATFWQYQFWWNSEGRIQIVVKWNWKTDTICEDNLCVQS